MSVITQINRSKATRVISQYLIDSGRSKQMRVPTFVRAVDIYEERLLELMDMYISHLKEPTEMDRMGCFSDAWHAIRQHYID